MLNLDNFDTLSLRRIVTAAEGIVARGTLTTGAGTSRSITAEELARVVRVAQSARAALVGRGCPMAPA